MNDWVAILLSAISIILAFLGITWKMTKDLRDEHEEAISKVYKRFDDFKEATRNTHVSKELFTFVHQQLVSDIVEIKKDVKTLLKNGQSES